MKISRFCIPDTSFRESTIDLAKISAPAGALPHVSCFRNLLGWVPLTLLLHQYEPETEAEDRVLRRGNTSI
jgi:hypothetical protein